MKKIIIAPDSFKGTMSSIQVCDTIETAIKNIIPAIKTIKVPIADGGEGTVEAFLSAVGGDYIKIKVKDPYLRDIQSFYGILSDGKTAIVEMAVASGLPLVEGEENPLKASTYGTGQLIMDAINKGCRKIIVGIGGSATCDGGIGMASALGVRFLDKNNNEISPDGQGMGSIQKIDMSVIDKRIQECTIITACDVDNMLYGENGAAYVFAPQKGADAEMVKILDNNLRHYAEIVKRDLGIDVHNIPGSGAAGGLGAGLIAFMGSKLERGINIILDVANFDKIIVDADLIITGEGKMDGQSLRGKVPIGIAKRAQKYKIPVLAVVGDIGNNIEKVYESGISAVFSTNRVSLNYEQMKPYCREYLKKTVEDIMRFTRAIIN